jgi:hypothetical protein
VHRDAERAVVGIRRGRMDVRHLNYSQQRQQSQTQKRSRAQSPRLSAAITTQMGWQNGQRIILNFEITQ